MTTKHSIKTTLHRTITVFSLLSALCLLLLMIAYAFVVEDNVFNRLVAAEARFIEQHYQQSGEIIMPRQPFMQLYRSWQQLPEHIQAQRQRSPQRVEFADSDGNTLHLHSVQLGQTEWVLAADVSAFEVTPLFLTKLAPYLSMVLLLVMLGALALSGYLSHIIIRPLQRLSATIEHHHPGESLQFDKRLPDNEIGYLGQTIQQNIAQLQAALAREADFTRDVSHELRTPATVLKMALARLNSSTVPDPQTLAQLSQSAAQMEKSLHELLALARAESLAQQPLCLLAEIEACLINHPKFVQQPDLQLALSVSASYRLNANQNLLHILLNNVIDNALTHASSGALQIKLTAHQLTFGNPVVQHLTPVDCLRPGIKSDVSPGLGQGLHIVNRICQSHHWQLQSRLTEDWFSLTVNFAPDNR